MSANQAPATPQQAAIRHAVDTYVGLCREWRTYNPLFLWMKHIDPEGKMTHGDIASECGTSSVTVQNWLRGYVNPNRVNMIYLAHFMKRDASDLTKDWLDWRRAKPVFHTPEGISLG